MTKILFPLFISLATIQSFATFSIGTGYNTTTGGRTIPSFNLGFAGGSLEYLIASTGVSTTSYYHSSYSLGIYHAWKAGDIASGPINAGFGGGALYAVRGLKETGSSLVTKSDYVLGPAFFGRWNFLGPAYVSVECLYGIIGPSSRWGDLLGMNARDHVNLSFGVSL